MNKDNDIRTHLKINGVTRAFFLARDANAENEPYRDTASLSNKVVAEKKRAQSPNIVLFLFMAVYFEMGSNLIRVIRSGIRGIRVVLIYP